MKKFPNLAAIKSFDKRFIRSWKIGSLAYPQDIEFIVVNNQYEIWADGTKIDEMDEKAKVPAYIDDLAELILKEPEIIYVSAEPENIVLSKDGKIRAKDAKMQVIGDYEHRQPNKEEDNPYKGCKGYKLVSDIWSGGIPYRGMACGYTRKEFVQSICEILKRKPIVIQADGKALV